MDNKTQERDQAQLKVEGLSCRRGDRLLFKNISLTLNPGDIFEVTGQNGAGKTTLLRLLCGLLIPEKGNILWGNQPINKVKPTYYSNLAYVGHTDAIKADLTVSENLTIAKALNGGGIEVKEALYQVGLLKLQSLPGRFLSAGQRRRLALARLLVNRAELWLLDEPFTALDKEAVKTIASLLEVHGKNGGMVIFTSHHSVNVAGAQALNISSAISS
ncbi:cytochrome c biogenesis heme-transporting ATPase CcmA [Candidatus Nitrosacidococcus sp. I8]|uniref:cytochrome c biogenesis heme-transporting ATPase CcmA n=1 Tax=Candidatus Nitrosacidococcus sp. I8 TaxID=2942908 RepID=UPI0022278138|nr:cytochrome c biogenesis heme-transporting ATPase CcmA [Candidatus Nitrosacidococcus sp. I8]CAH9018974.1 Cytochrome c biogenesis ATP-binding export protein CcmA [Candidatus Nitrosacidococcus sp. I8]